jgi:hypothetical protein
MRYQDWESWEAHELQGLVGVPDKFLVLWKSTCSGNRVIRTIAFEIKRDNWRRALVQAYRYLAFADYSFVVMDAAFVHRPITAIDQFKRANIGLLSVSKTGEVEWHYTPRLSRPYSDSARTFLREAIHAHLFDIPKRNGGPTIKWSFSEQAAY